MAEASAPVGGAERGMGDGFAPFRQNWGGRPKPETATVFPLGPSKRIYASWRRRVAHAEIGAYGEPHGDRLTNYRPSPCWEWLWISCRSGCARAMRR